MKKFLLAAFVITLTSLSTAQEYLPYKDSKLPVEKRVTDLLTRLTLEEKIDLLGGTGFATKPNSRLGIPELRMTDGPVGVRWGEATAFPVGIAMAATWNPDLVEKIGSAIGREVKGKGRHVILGPCVNIARIPQGGRNFESFGEDPFLASMMAVDYITGVQKENVAATIKHFAANNQEYQREFVNTIVSERALNEIYFPAFKAGVKEAKVLCLMSSYNKLNGPYASENDYLLIEKLKKEWGFEGLVMSDWGAVHSSVATAKGGLDLEMPTGKFMNQKTLLAEVGNGNILQSTLDDKVKRILTVMFKLGLFDNVSEENAALVNSQENREVALQTSRESIVLLKNDLNILPLNKNKLRKIAVIGPSANILRTGGGGSSMVSPINPVTPLEGLMNRVGSQVQISFAQGVRLEGDAHTIETENLFTDKTEKKHGLNAEYYPNRDFSGEPLSRIDPNINFWWSGGAPSKDFPEDNFTVRWTGYIKAPAAGQFVLTISSDDGCRLFVDDEKIFEDWNDHGVTATSGRVNMVEGRLYKLKIEYYENVGDAVVMFGWRMPGEDLIKEAVETAKNSDVAIIFAGTTGNFESEGRDRDNLFLPNDQDSLIEKIVGVNPNTIVVLQNGSPVMMGRWLHKVKGVVEAWFPGVEGGNAIADVLIGNYNPSGKLPVTFPQKWEDCSAFNSYKQKDGTTIYGDGIFVGYRHFDKNKIEPLFPFGFGLSYTTFEFGNLMAAKDAGKNINVSFSVTNTGSIKGAEVAQVYLSPVDPSVERAVKELKNFLKVELEAGKSSVVKLILKPQDFAYYDENTHDWKIDPGKYKIMIGNSSRDIKLQAEVSID